MLNYVLQVVTGTQRRVVSELSVRVGATKSNSHNFLFQYHIGLANVPAML